MRPCVMPFAPLTNPITNYERALCDQLLDGLASIQEVKVWGITEPEHRSNRCSTISLTHANCSAADIAKRLGEVGIYVWSGNYYALPLTERLGVEPEGMVRIGLVHYNTPEEIDYLLGTLRSLSS